MGREGRYDLKLADVPQSLSSEDKEDGLSESGGEHWTPRDGDVYRGGVIRDFIRYFVNCKILFSAQMHWFILEKSFKSGLAHGTIRLAIKSLVSLLYT